MKIFVLALLFLLSMVPIRAVSASDPKPEEEEKTLTPEDLSSAMADAEKEYQAAKRNGTRSSSLKAAPLREDLSALVSQLTQATKVEKGTLLEDLAAQVDVLKNKVVVERATLLATQSPRKVKVRGAKTVFNYQEDAVYEVTAAIDHVTDIQLRSGEGLTTPPTSGDTVRWNIGVMKSGSAPLETTHVIVKPLDDQVETNLIITTDQHTYQLKLRSGDFHMPAVSWNYPSDHEAEILAALKRDESQEPTITPELLRFAYEIDGRDYSWKPIRVFDDGKKTFIQMPKDLRVTDAPVLFLIEDGSDPLLTNYRVKGDYYIVDRLFDKAELRVGVSRKITIELQDGKSFFARLFS